MRFAVWLVASLLAVLPSSTVAAVVGGANAQKDRAVRLDRIQDCHMKVLMLSTKQQVGSSSAMKLEMTKIMPPAADSQSFSV
eukprot:1931782-Amphidinium_carterae.1